MKRTFTNKRRRRNINDKSLYSKKPQVNKSLRNNSEKKIRNTRVRKANIKKKGRNLHSVVCGMRLKNKKKRSKIIKKKNLQIRVIYQR